MGLYYYKARYYSPDLRRFITTDPISYGDGMNMYAYVGGDPINSTDPSGLSGCRYRPDGVYECEDVGTTARQVRNNTGITGSGRRGRNSHLTGPGFSAGGGSEPTTWPRNLTKLEKNAISECIKKGIDLDKVQIYNRKWTPFTKKIQQ